jgi:hypothetical protein
LEKIIMNTVIKPKALVCTNGKPASDPLLPAFLHVAAGTMAICLSVLCTQLFDGVATDLGLEHYAESTNWLPSALAGRHLPMPFNTAVNAGYLIVGTFWIHRVRRLWQQSKLCDMDCYLFYVFCWMAVMYGPVQFSRIVTQHHHAAVLDQWFTLPIFAWVIVLCRAVGADGSRQEINIPMTFAIMLASCLSYCLTIIHVRGFEIALAVHITVVVGSSWFVHQRAPAASRQHRLVAFFKAVACCFGFVGLKLADHYLTAISPSLFTVLSGHFWSKIADFMQIHYVCEFFLATISIPSTVSNHKYN